MVFKNKWFQLCLAAVLGLVVLLLPRPEGTKFKVAGDPTQELLRQVGEHFVLVPPEKAAPGTYTLQARNPGTPEATAKFLQQKAGEVELKKVEIGYVDGLSPKAKRFLAVLAFLIFLFVAEPIPLEITAICIAVFLVVMDIGSVKDAWAPYMHPVVVFIMCCLIFAIALEKTGTTKRLGYFIIRKAGRSLVRFTFIISIGLGLASGVMHDAAACAIGLVTMLPLMRAVGIPPYSNTAKFMMLSLPFACSAGGMGTLIGGGRNMVAAAFLKEFTGIELTFFDWILYALPAAIVTVPAAVAIVYLVYRPEAHYQLPEFHEELGPWTPAEKRNMIVIGLTFLAWLTKGLHGIDYS
ncbi:MAG: SLC13 family permease, partial [Acidobacteriota bacterium]